MPITGRLSVPALVHEKHLGTLDNWIRRLGEGLVERFDHPLPFSATRRNCLAAFFVMAVAVLFYQPLGSLYSLTLEEKAHYSHILIIPWVSLYFLYLDRKAIHASREWSPLLGSILFGFGIFFYWLADPEVYGAGADRLSLEIFAFVLCSWSVFVLCYGAKSYRKFSFGLLFLLWMVPIPHDVLNSIIAVLQRSSTEVVDILFSMIGIPYLRDGFIFSLSNLSIYVAEECSGIRSALALFITSLVAGHFFLRSPWTKISLIALMMPLAVVKNGFRIVGLTLLANYVDPTFITESSLHHRGGIPLFLLSLVVLFALTYLLRLFEKKIGYRSPC